MFAYPSICICLPIQILSVNSPLVVRHLLEIQYFKINNNIKSDGTICRLVKMVLFLV